MFSVAKFIVLEGGQAKAGGSFWPALIGAAVGGAISLATTLLVEHRRARAAETDQKRRLLADARIAGRIIRLELEEVESVLRIAIQQPSFRWPPSLGYALPVKAWSEYAAKLGAVVPDNVWDEVSLPYSSFEYANLLGSVKEGSAQTMLDETSDAIKALDFWAKTASIKEPAGKGYPKL